MIDYTPNDGRWGLYCMSIRGTPGAAALTAACRVISPIHVGLERYHGVIHHHVIGEVINLGGDDEGWGFARS